MITTIVPTGPPVGVMPETTGVMRKGARLLASVPVGVVTSIFPVVAPLGTVVLIAVDERTVKDAGMPLKVTLRAPVKSVPKIVTGEPPRLSPAGAPRMARGSVRG